VGISFGNYKFVGYRKKNVGGQEETATREEANEPF